MQKGRLKDLQGGRQAVGHACKERSRQAPGKQTKGLADMQRDIWMDDLSGRQTDRQLAGQKETDRWIDRQTARQAGRDLSMSSSQGDKRIGRQACRENGLTERQTGRQTGR